MLYAGTAIVRADMTFDVAGTGADMLVLLPCLHRSPRRYLLSPPVVRRYVYEHECECAQLEKSARLPGFLPSHQWQCGTGDCGKKQAYSSLSPLFGSGPR